jgi:UDP-N-acetylglucosamine--dolichyl-phosphate N-acetylglucosaminephosphotransferase
MELLLLLPVGISFLVALFCIPVWIKKAKEQNISGRDIHKISKEEVAEAGGVCAIIGFVFGSLIYIGIRTFIFESYENTMEIFCLLSVILIISFVGFTDDILGWKKGLSKISRIFFLAFAAFPLLAINAGQAVTGTNLELIYPLFIIIIGFIGASATFNFLAGYNGLEASQGIIILTALSIVTYLTGNRWLSIIGLIMVAGLFAFYIFNKHPAKIFPGDILTYPVGALIAIIAIFGSVEKIAIFFFIPYILETILKIRGKLKKESFAKLNPDGSLEMPYEKIYGVEHIAIYILKKIKPSHKVYEKDVVLLINMFQIFIIILGLVIFKVDVFKLPSLVTSGI